MARAEIQIPKNLADELEESFHQGPMLNEHGKRALNERLVDRINKMSVHIWADEHPPPHFHVKFAGENASFSISDCERLKNVRGLEKFEHNIKRWWQKNYCKLIEVWNATRPSGCPVGPVPVPPQCLPNKQQRAP